MDQVNEYPWKEGELPPPPPFADESEQKQQPQEELPVLKPIPLEGEETEDLPEPQDSSLGTSDVPAETKPLESPAVKQPDQNEPIKKAPEKIELPLIEIQKAQLDEDDILIAVRNFLNSMTVKYRGIGRESDLKKFLVGKMDDQNTSDESREGARRALEMVNNPKKYIKEEKVGKILEDSLTARLGRLKKPPTGLEAELERKISANVIASVDKQLTSRSPEEVLTSVRNLLNTNLQKEKRLGYEIAEEYLIIKDALATKKSAGTD